LDHLDRLGRDHGRARRGGGASGGRYSLDDEGFGIAAADQDVVVPGIERVEDEVPLAVDGGGPPDHPEAVVGIGLLGLDDEVEPRHVGEGYLPLNGAGVVAVKITEPGL